MNKKTKVRNMFDSIAGKYDFLNHFLSAGVDIYWRKKAIRLTKLNGNSILLDVACGTGDFALTALKSGVKNIYGADLSFEMLKLFNKKSEYSRGKILQMTAENAPFKSGSFTNITVAFGVRNFYDIQKSFDVFYDILKQGGKATILEFSLPKNKLFLALYNFYFNNILPAIGKFFSKDKEAYKYLPDSVKEFDENVNLPELFRNSGFKKVDVYPLTFGIAQITIAEK
ncbi:MAG TPA: bifunctional demethylmenaquinone methyltransferase/2-methoxy-6-polyprenyl-1,4-benzoquinol methylase UbiE [Ignavibacteriales bacterium]|nr:bifunctional demethylmenaquinone methyltransferase/2-methoxy-6-polyprenyl-1,4-benzoquinol methylase UbiE [Ignavibacteriales bacterium]HEX3074534.1 bifunctional demethylmenaquinone methyltransferase/2-methoxy-6-polyprenyl-1,4-benzoquinol methylase UbiE [Ignavibacteriales bacterium]